MRNKSLVLLGVIAIALAGCQGGASGTPTKLTIAALQGDESLGLKAIAPDCGTKSGTTVEIVENPYGALYDKLVTTFKANDATFDLVMIDDPWMPKFGTDGSLQDLGQYGIEPILTSPSIVWDVGTWPPPHGAVPPSEVGKPAQLLGVTVVGNVEMFMNRSDIAPRPRRPTTTSWPTRRRRTSPTSRDTSSAARRPTRSWPTSCPSSGRSAATCSTTTGTSSSTTTSRRRRSSSSSTTSRPVAQADPANTDAADRDRSMATGRASSHRSGRARSTGIVDNAEVSKVIGKAAFIPIPAGPSGKGIGMMGNWMLAIPKASKNQQPRRPNSSSAMLQADIAEGHGQQQGHPEPDQRVERR